MNDSNKNYIQLLEDLENIDTRIRKEKTEKLRIANKIAAVMPKKGGSERDAAFKKMADLLSPEEMTEKFTRLLSQSKVDLTNVASFKQLLVQATRRRQLFNYQPEWKLNNKRAAYRFIDELGVKRPTTYSFNQPLDEIILKPASVLKPEQGSSSQGVFIFDEKGGAFEVRSGEVLRTSHDAIKKARDLMASGVIKKDSWMVEEFIGDFHKGKPLPTIDLKFYSFFGDIGFVLEVERGSKTRYREWMPDGRMVDTGLYSDKDRFVGRGFTNEQLEFAKYISSKIYAPFMRIDFIKSEKAFSFGEFTPRPGQFSDFSKGFDRYLGDCYLKAEAKLNKYLISKCEE